MSNTCALSHGKVSSAHCLYCLPNNWGRVTVSDYRPRRTAVLQGQRVKQTSKLQDAQPPFAGPCGQRIRLIHYPFPAPVIPITSVLVSHRAYVIERDTIFSKATGELGLVFVWMTLTKLTSNIDRLGHNAARSSVHLLGRQRESVVLEAVRKLGFVFAWMKAAKVA